MNVSTRKECELTLVGAGLAGSLLAIYLARRGFKTTIYERRSDLREERVPAGRSINLALANRGIAALKQVGLFAEVEKLLIPMRGRMLHSVDGQLSFQPYGKKASEVIYSVSRASLNGLMLSAAEATGSVAIRFDHQCIGFECESGELRLMDTLTERPYAIRAHPVIATDGAGSLVRHAMIDQLDIESVEDVLPHAYKELTIPANPDGSHRMEPSALHIWPRGGYMLIALPNLDGTFTATLFLPKEGEPSFARLDSRAALRTLFEREFPDVFELMPDLEREYFHNPVGTLGTVRCHTWHDAGRALLLGDAAHAIVPFHGQGMNCAFEDCVTLDACIERFGTRWDQTFREFQSLRKPNAEAIADMALENYVEMRDSVQQREFQIKKDLGWLLEERHPGVFIPRYSMVMFHHIPYAEAQRRGAIQQSILDELCQGIEDVRDVNLSWADELINQRLLDA